MDTTYSPVPGWPRLRYEGGHLWRGTREVPYAHTEHQGWFIVEGGYIQPLLPILATVKLGRPLKAEESVKLHGALTLENLEVSRD